MTQSSWCIGGPLAADIEGATKPGGLLMAMDMDGDGDIDEIDRALAMMATYGAHGAMAAGRRLVVRRQTKVAEPQVADRRSADISPALAGVAAPVAAPVAVSPHRDTPARPLEAAEVSPLPGVGAAAAPQERSPDSHQIEQYDVAGDQLVASAAPADLDPGAGNAALVDGDLEGARNIVVLVPDAGGESTLRDQLPHSQAVLTEAGPGTAAVTWVGNDAQDLKQLTGDLATKHPDARITMVGHNESSEIVQAAVSQGAPAHAAVLATGTDSPAFKAAANYRGPTAVYTTDVKPAEFYAPNGDGLRDVGSISRGQGSITEAVPVNDSAVAQTLSEGQLTAKVVALGGTTPAAKMSFATTGSSIASKGRGGASQGQAREQGK